MWWFAAGLEASGWAQSIGRVESGRRTEVAGGRGLLGPAAGDGG